MSDHT